MSSLAPRGALALLSLLAAGESCRPVCLSCWDGVSPHTPPPVPAPEAPTRGPLRVSLGAGRRERAVRLPGSQLCAPNALRVEPNREPPVAWWLRDEELPTARCTGADSLLVSLPRAPPLRHGDLLARVRTSNAPDARLVEVTLEVEPLGFADLHSHPAAHLGFGGRSVWGSPCGPASSALADCDCDHQTLVAVTGETGDHHHGVHGYPSFAHWPTWDSWTHQQFHVSWLDRARRGGLRLLVAHAVENQSLCSVRPAMPGHAPYDCFGDPMETVRRQLQFLHELERYVDALEGGPGRGWLRLARSPEEAERAIRNGHLTVVLGVEIDQLLGCGPLDAACRARSLSDRVDELCRWGVRHLFPIHFRSNEFGGTAFSNPLTGPFSDAVECAQEGYTYPGDELLIRCTRLGAACSGTGLTERGLGLLDELLSRGMLFDVDHMGRRARRATLAYARSLRYPVVSGHTEFLDLQMNDQRSERGLEVQDLRAIDDLGGMLAPIALQLIHTRDLRPVPWSHLPAACPDSAEGYAHAYAFARGFFRGPIAFGTDMMGGIDQPGPRFQQGPHGLSPRACLEYDQPHSVFDPRPALSPVPSCFRSLDSASALPVAWHDGLPGATRVWNYNTDGVAHVGLLPEFVFDVRQHLDASLEPEGALTRTALEYVSLWRRAERSAAAHLHRNGLCSSAPRQDPRPVTEHRAPLACPAHPGPSERWSVDTCTP